MKKELASFAENVALSAGKIILESINNIEVAQSIFSNYGIELIKIGSTNNSGVMIFNNVVKLSVKKVKDAWTNGLREKL